MNKHAQHWINQYLNRRNIFLAALWFCLITACMNTAQATAQNLQARIDKSDIALEETFTLSVRYEGNSSEEPDLSMIEQDFDVLGKDTRSNRSIINGRVSSSVQWNYTLGAKKPGSFVLGPITLGDAESLPVGINVRPSDTNTQVFVETLVDKSTSFVQEQVVLTIRLYTAVSLTGIDLQPLTLANAPAHKINETQYDSQKNGEDYRVVETQYAIYPQASGDFVIPSLAYPVVTTTGSRDIWGRLTSQTGAMLRLRTEEKVLTIKPIPAEFAGKNWLPSTGVTVQQHFNTSLDNLKVGDAITRTITIKAEQLTSGQITPLNFSDIEGLTFYPDQPQSENQLMTHGVLGTLTQTLAMVPSHAGKITLPAIEIPWYNTATGQQETARIPEANFHVAASGFKAPDTGSLEQDTLEFIPKVKDPLTTGQTVTPLWMWIWAITASALCILLAALWLVARKRSHIQQASVDHQEDTATENLLWSDLKKASSKNDLNAMRDAVIRFGRHHFNKPQLASLEEFKQLTNNDLISEQIDELNRALFQKPNEQTWDAGNLTKEIYNLRKTRRSRKSIKTHNLKSLYP